LDIDVPTKKNGHVQFLERRQLKNGQVQFYVIANLKGSTNVAYVYKLPCSKKEKNVLAFRGATACV